MKFFIYKTNLHKIFIKNLDSNKDWYFKISFLKMLWLFDMKLNYIDF